MEIFGCIVVAMLGAFQFWAAFDGAAHYLGALGAIAIFLACIVFRTTLPLMVLGFLGVWVVWGWWWLWAALLMAPMPMIALPSLVADVVAWWWRVLSVRH
jgi:hypothetical protein